MQIQDDNFPYSSADPSLNPVENPDSNSLITPQQINDLKATLRLLVGSTLNGRDLFVSRLRRMQAEQETVRLEAVAIDANETSRDRLRYFILGALFEAPDYLQRAMEATGGTSSRIIGSLSRIFSPITNSWLFGPVRNQYNTAEERGQQIIERLVMKGRVEEQNSRQIMQEKAVDDLLNEFVEYLVLKTEIRQIIQEEGITVAGDVAGEFQEESAAVDSMLEHKLKSIFQKRGTPSQPVTPPENPEEGG